MRKLAVPAVLLLLLPAAAVFAHVTPNVELVRKGDFLRASLPGAVNFFDKRIDFGAADLAAIRRATGWTPGDDVKVYVGRDGEGKLVGSVVFVWVPSEHGPVGLGVAFDTGGRLARAELTDIGTEPLAWVRPLLANGGLASWRGLEPTAAPDPTRLAPGVTGTMSRYYAKVIAQGVTRAQAVEQVALATGAAQK